MANFYKNAPITNLGVSNFPIDSAGLYTLDASFQLPSQVPTAASGPGGGGIGSSSVPGLPIASQVVAVVKVNASTIYTGPAGAKGCKVAGISIAANDVLSITLSSSLSMDQQLNAIQGSVSISEGAD